MNDFERLGLFYLGRPVDTASGAPIDEPFLLNARDLTTHAVCVGMTGSGKTGLCLDLLEEAAIDGVPVIAIDPKGDVGNLALTFPSLDGAAFAPWVNPADAEGAGLTRDAFAEREATRWREGLAAWGQDGARIARLRQAADIVVYTPGSTAGRPLSILGSLTAPPGVIASDAEALADRVGSTVDSLLSLLGVSADPLSSREHILLSTILTNEWQNGRSLDLGSLIGSIQSPGVPRIGVMELEAFYPKSDRFALAMRVNNLLAAPGFSAWLAGEALDIGRLLYGPTGKPRVSVIAVAHLDDAERMFAVSLLLAELVAWMRAQPGTSSLRALLYMDEVFGYLPPIAAPPSKRPLLTLLKQARAFGVGVCLATQNPVDLDYKALSNTGTWFIGRLQTDRDRARLLDGLDGAGGGSFNRESADSAIASLGKRRFYVHSVHASAPVVIESRWCLSYLRGPMTRDDIKRLVGSVPSSEPRGFSPGSSPGPEGPGLQPVGSLGPRPILPPEIPQFFVSAPSPDGARDGIWVPHLYGAAEIAFADSKRGIDERKIVQRLVPLTRESTAVDWDAGTDTSVAPAELSADPTHDAPFGGLPAQASQTKVFAKWSKDFDRWLSRTQRLARLTDAATGLVADAGEDERTFSMRVADHRRAARDASVDKIRARFATKLRTAEDKVRRLEQALGKERQDVEQHRMQAGLSTASTIGAAVIGAIFGRRGGVTATTIGKASTAAKGWARGSKEAEDVKRAEENLAAARQARLDLEQDVERAIESAAFAQGSGTRSADGPLETLNLTPKRGGVHVSLVALVWTLSGSRASRD